jgi:uncharacterized repeat protein (TIGR03803 family)
MKSLDSGCYAVTIGVAAAMLAGCGGSQPPVGLPGRMLDAKDNDLLYVSASTLEMIPTATADNLLGRSMPAPSFRIVYSFRGSGDGAAPRAGVIALKGTLYGTTSGSDRSGTVFSVTATGTHIVLHHLPGAMTAPIRSRV